MSYDITYKIVVIGDGSVGKTTFIRRFVPIPPERKYISNIAADIIPVIFNTTKGNIKLNIWDTAGQERFGGLRDGWYIMASACIIMFDVTSRLTYKSVPMWYTDIVRVCGNIPIVLVGNKIDVKDRKVLSKSVSFHVKKQIRYCEISALANFHMELPFLLLLQALTSDDSLEILDVPKCPPEITMDPGIMLSISQAYQKEDVPDIEESDDEM